ncbi:uncharacterized protein LOC128733540 [Sabethes cyaneus]|uniref:uncharacterized protein LOC128733540 n=1 Tax=Sabethes cyaneus TaxID=53552 RepID=UPI00237DE49A|nr:uncharacterized protein LOC128733540 [Sabethes cyaneus]
MSKKSDSQKRGVSPANQLAEINCDICRMPDDSRMVACDLCGKWYHFVCVGVDSSVQDRDWSCENCTGIGAAAQVPAGTSTPAATGGKPKSGSTKTHDVVPVDSLQRQLAEMLKKMERQQKEFERVIKEKDDQRRDALREQRDKYERELQVSDRRVRQQPVTAALGGVPTANSTSNPLPSVHVSGISQADVLVQELQLLEEKQALERRHLEEKGRLLKRFGAFDGGAAEGASGLNPQASAVQPPNSSSFGVSLLNQSQVSARQVVSKELPNFSGSPEEWPLFFASYENSTRICGYSDEENLLRLQRSLKGRALDAVRCRLLHPSNLAGVIATLRTLFGRPEIIVHSLVAKIRDMPAPKAEKLSTLIDFGVAVQNVCATITASGLDEYLCNVALLQELTEKLPPTVRLNWAYHRQTLASVTLSDFGDWLGKLVEAASVVTIPSIGVSKPEKHGRRENNYLNVHSDSTSEELIPKNRSVAASKSCTVCLGECSGPESCRKFLNMNIGDRWTVVKAKKLCRKCLQKHFGACHVKTPCGKDGCSFMHSKLLHDDKRYKPAVSEMPASSSEGLTTQSCNTHSNTAGKILFRYVPVTIFGKGKTVNTFAFLDDGSSATFVEHSLVEELGLEGIPHPLCLNWTGGQQREENESVRLALKISGTFDSSKVYELSKVHTVRNLSLPKQSVSVEQLASKYKYLRGLPLDSYTDVSPRILIGMDNCRLGNVLRSSEGAENEPVASRTRLGWLVYGPCTTMSTNTTYSGCHSFHICPCNTEIDRSLDGALKEYFSIESLGISGSFKPLLSKDEERAMKILSTETHLNENRYETALLWRYDNVRLPDSRAMALKRLACLEKRMKRDPELAVAMNTRLKEYEEKGYIRRLSAVEQADRRPNDWYLPVFPVINPNKPGKIRMVFDAAAKVNGVSLNSVLLTGPDQLVSLLTVLFKFREFRFAVVGDIREMFFQVRMRVQDQRSQMILWNSGNPNEDPVTYVVSVMTFGAACSPSCAHYVKNLNADRFVERFPRAVESIKYEHYVDDMLCSVETEEEAVQLARDVRFVHSQAGFEIRNWLSNSSKVTASLQEDTTTEKNINPCTEMATEKVLGMWWDTASDTFTFRLSPKHDAKLLSGARMPTKREVLRTLMAIYDPIGLIGNFLMYLKILLQEIWRSGCAWDDEIAGSLAEKWLTWIAVLPDVRNVRVPRCYRVITSANTTNVQLHIFCDASENGIAAVAYFRFEENGVIECAMIGSKTRVAPLKFLSIPRLELQAAVIGARLAGSIAGSHRIKISQQIFWTDSRDVVCWIRSDHRRFSPFVAFRVSELLETTRVNDWRWVPTRLNVADDGTKWQRLPDLRPTSRWFCGPDFLRKPENEWPGEGCDPGTTVEEMRSSVLHHMVAKPLIDFVRFSKWKRLLRAVAYVVRFAANLLNRRNRIPTKLGPLEKDELNRAEQIIYREVQRQVYPDEVRLLSNVPSDKPSWQYNVPKTSPLHEFSPAVDEHGVLRMRGRIDACEWVDESVKHPILLPKQHFVTDLIIASYHETYRHRNHQTVLNEFRLKYCVPRLRSEYNRVRRNCQYCKIHRADPEPPAMGNLPPTRLAAYQRPFSYSGIDYFGPMLVLVGKRVEKRWGVLLTCLTTRGVHIELAHSLSTDSCILALRNFIARRGTPLEIISDRGTNFVGASRELREALKTVDEEKLMTSFTGANTKWIFNPPAAPHFGGCWERLVQSFKKVMKEFKPPRLPSDEILRSMLIEIEMIINSRPLTHVSLDTETEPPLTPNHFLLGCSNGSKPPIAFDDRPMVLKQSWKMSQLYADVFWKKWVAEYLPTLTKRTKWFQPAKPIEEGQLALIVDNGLPRNCWPRGRIVNVVRSSDGQVRRVTVQTASGLLERPAVKIAILDVDPMENKPLQLQQRTRGECHTPAASADTPPTGNRDRPNVICMSSSDLDD